MDSTPSTPGKTENGAAKKRKRTYNPNHFVWEMFTLTLYYIPGVMGVLMAVLFLIQYPMEPKANPAITPLGIVPEWYFLPFYAILRAIPDKLGGVAAMGGAIVILLFLPFINTSKVRSSTFRPFYRKLYWFLFADFLLLGWAGQEVVAEPFVLIGQLGTVFYFFYFLILIPSLGIIEHLLINTELN